MTSTSLGRSNPQLRGIGLTRNAMQPFVSAVDVMHPQAESDPSRFYTMPSCSQQFRELSSETLDQAMLKIEHCLDQLSDSQVWWRPEPSMNSFGNLMLHLAGNLRQWGIVPSTMAKDRRDRESEFSDSSRLPTDELIGLLRQTVSEAKEEWRHLNDDSLSRLVTIQGFDVTLMHAIIHTTNHFVGHTHQMVMLTRMQLGSAYRFHWTPAEDRSSVPV